ncbi:MAG: hypothetical protein CVU64_19505 [Deltaproteobacteria bacterium HGW-Deltaproteobacteria-21]|nr:MAG: hypothetical protein CVU64_19505 [Deltaproteobacteria bacterium HGW-Deltaproteobacteria-21]
MRTRKELLGVFLSLLLLACFSADGFAEEMTGGKINFGKLTIVPGLALQEVYDDNIFLGNGTNVTGEAEESDWITHVMPNLLVNYDLPDRGRITAGYLGDYAYYKDFDDVDWKNHTALFNFDYEAPGGLIAGVENTYIDAEDPFGSENQYKLGRQTERWSDTLRTKLGFRFSDRFRVLTYFNYYKQDYDALEDFTQDWDDQEFGAGFEMRVLPRTWAFVRYFTGERDFYTHPEGFGVNDSNDADYDWQRVNVGLAWDPEGKLRGELNFGYAWKDYENTFDPTGALYDEKDTWIASTRITYAATATTNLSLTILRAVRDTGANTNEYFEDTGASIGLIQELYYKLSLLANVGYSKNEYNLPVNNPRDQDNYLASVGLEYRLLDWLAAMTTYTYNRKDSNYAEDDYVVNKFLVGLRALY